MKDYSNYHSADTNGKITNDGDYLFEYQLTNGFESYDVVINDTLTTRAIITSKFSNKNGMVKNIIGRIAEIDRGKKVVWKGSNWLITTLPEDNTIYRKAELKQCNQTLTLPGEPTKELVGYDEFERPVYNTIPGTPINIPCVVETSFYRSDESQEPINLPEGKTITTIPFTVHDNLVLGGEITLYNETYSITGIDKTQSNGTEGLLLIHAEKVVS